MMGLFDGLKERKLANDMCSCSDCGWEGPVASCGKYEDDDGWESCVRYTVFTCPLCSMSGSEGNVDDFYNSIEAAQEKSGVVPLESH